jgi:hypothetical protein
MKLFIDQDAAIQLMDNLELKIKSLSLPGLSGVTFHLDKTEIFDKEVNVGKPFLENLRDMQKMPHYCGI